MVFSKSFGYALRGILYVAIMNRKKKRVRLDEIAETLNIPRHFLGKIMKRLVKYGVLDSVKGPYGGFSLNPSTMDTPLIRLVEITGEMEKYKMCALGMKQCNGDQPCPLHDKIDAIKKEWIRIMSENAIGFLLQGDQSHFIDSISTRYEISALSNL
jgi:Rrf2 family iron-sulfur cluster assembly transcriptional regulator